MKVREASEKAVLKLNIQKTKIMASCPITLWQTDGKTMETVTDFLFLDSKINVDSDCSHEIGRCLLLGRKAMTNLECILKSRDIILPTKVPIVKIMVFPVVMYGCESWTIKKAEHWRTDAFKLWCWRTLLRVPWTARRSNQLLLKETNREYFLEGPTLKPKLQYFGYLMQTISLLEKTLILGKIEGRRRREQQDEMVGWHHWYSGHEFDQSPGDGERQRDLSCCSSWGCKASDTTEILNNNNPVTKKILHRIRAKKFTICMESQKIPNVQSNLEKGKWSWRNQDPCLQKTLESSSNKDSMVLAQNQKYISGQDRKSRDKFKCIWSPNLWKRRQEYTMEKKLSLQ